jgi:uncharacterized Zn finger protein
MPRTLVKSDVSPQESTEASAGFVPLTERLIREQTDSGSFSRGQSYLRNGYLFDTYRRGNVLHARSHGSSGGPYRIEATLTPADATTAENPVTFFCDCPRGGFCKHVVAMLLAWVNAPEDFGVRPPVGELLAGKSREELIALIEQMLQAEPDLENLIALPMPGAGRLDGHEVDEAAIRRQVEAALRDDDGYDRRGYHDDYHAGSRVGGKLRRLVALGTAYADAGEALNAVNVLATIVEAAAGSLSTLRDDGGEFGQVLIECDATLAAVLDAQGELDQ